MKSNTIKSVSFLWISSVLGSGSTLITNMLLARTLGADHFGVFSSALSVAMFFTLLAVFGVPQVWLKIFGQEGWAGIRWINLSLQFVAGTSVGASLLLSLWALFGPHEAINKELLFLMCFFLYGQVLIELVASKLQLEGRFTALAVWQVLPNLSRLLLIILLFFSNSYGISQIGCVYALVGTVVSIVGIFQLYMMKNGLFILAGHIKKTQQIAIPKMEEFTGEVFPFAMASLFAYIYVKSDIVMVDYIAGSKEAGCYNVAFVILQAILIFPTTLYSKFLIPKYHRWANYKREKFLYSYKKGNLVMAFTGVLVMIFIVIFSKKIILFFFGEEYLHSIILLNILSLTIPISFLSYNVGSTLITKNHMQTKFKLMGAAAFVNIILNSFTILLYGSIGAAISTVITNMFLFLLYLNMASKKVFPDNQ
ncbi:MAG: flippase [Candidatus Electrothrix sp. AR1]|nr:flippase [Candidatus Electrothrix sp. AR1]